MKRYADLTDEQKKAAVAECFKQEVEAIMELGINALPSERLRRSFKKAIVACEANRTPWFFCEFLLDHKNIKNHVEKLAQEHAEEAFYPEPGEFTVDLPLSLWR